MRYYSLLRALLDPLVSPPQCAARGLTLAAPKVPTVVASPFVDVAGVGHASDGLDDKGDWELKWRKPPVYGWGGEVERSRVAARVASHHVVRQRCSP